MKTKISFKPTYNQSMSQICQVKPYLYKFYYLKGEDRIELSTDLISNSLDNLQAVVLVDNYNIWNIDDFGLIIERKIDIGNIKALFGYDGLASDKSEIGLAIRIMSQSSNRHSVYQITSFTNNSAGDSNSFDIKLHLKPHCFSGNITIEPIFYLKKSSCESSDFPYDEVEGSVLGIIDRIKISFDGVGSVFPIFEIEEKNKQLWFVTFDSNDLLTDPFAKDYVEIYINKWHPDYPHLCADANLAFTPLFNEVISSALSQIIEKARCSGDWSEIINNDDLDSGTIGYAISYFKNVLGWDLSDPIKTSYSIRSFFNEEVVS